MLEAPALLPGFLQHSSAFPKALTTLTLLSKWKNAQWAMPDYLHTELFHHCNGHINICHAMCSVYFYSKIGLVQLLEQMGCTLLDTPDGICVTGNKQCRFSGIHADLSSCSDQTMTLAAIAMAPLHKSSRQPKHPVQFGSLLPYSTALQEWGM